MSATTIDPAALDRIRDLGGDPLVIALIDAALETMRARTAGAVDAASRDDSRGVQLEAHSLRSSAANVGAIRLSWLAEQVELRAEVGAGAELQDLVGDLATEFAVVERALEEMSP